MGALPPGGAMVAIEATEEELAAQLRAPEGISLAAINGPASVVVSGEEAAGLQLAGGLEGQGPQDHAPAGQPRLPLPADGADPGGVRRGRREPLSFSAPQIPIVSNLTGEILSAEQATSPAYWVRQVREAVRFKDGDRPT